MQISNCLEVSVKVKLTSNFKFSKVVIIMDSGRKTRIERMKTPVHLNSTVYTFKHSSTKKFSPNCSRRPNLSETVLTKSSENPKIKTKCLTSFSHNLENECDIFYNNYLQALLRRQCAKKKIEEQKQVLEEQLLLQNENLFKRKQHYQGILKDTEMFQKQSEVVEMINFLEENIDKLRSVYVRYNMQVELHNFKEILSSECDKVVLKNIGCLETQEDYDKFIDILQLCLSDMEKIIKSGRDFEGIHSVAENITNFINVEDKVLKSQQTISEMEKDCLYTFLKNTSDLFAKQYDNEHINQI